MAGYVEVACEMEPDQAAEYRRVEAILEATNSLLLRKGCMKLLGAYLWTTMDYPDRPFGWGHDGDHIKDVRKHLKKMDLPAMTDEEIIAKLGHTVGYWDKPKDKSIENFRGVVTPASMPEDTIFPKEQALIDICLKQKAEGTQTWVYVMMTGKCIPTPAQRLLEAEGLKVGILRSDDVEPIDRERWIESHGRDYDVMISNPELVSTGLDLFSKKQGGHNYSTIVFYETGYNLFTMRQAARRAWRIGQPRDCRIYYLYYKDTMQHKAMSLMSKKMAASQALEGEFSEDGLAAMAGDDNLQMALAKNLSERIDDADMQRGWAKVKSASGKKKMEKVKAKPKLNLDDLPMPVQMTVERIIENKAKPVPDSAKAEIAKMLAMFDDIEDDGGDTSRSSPAWRTSTTSTTTTSTLRTTSCCPTSAR